MNLQSDEKTRAQQQSDIPSTNEVNLLSWYVIQSKPREESRAEHFLREKGLQTYLPRMEVVRLQRGRNVIDHKPLFPSYLFCRFDLKKELAYAYWTKGVARILPESTNPVPVEKAVVDAIRSLQHKNGVIRQRRLRKNDRIRIARGPLKDILGIFQYWASDQGRVRVLLKFINYQATVELHHSLIEKAV